jgi:hypothetical protein
LRNLVRVGGLLVGGIVAISLISFTRYLGYNGQPDTAFAEHFLPWVALLVGLLVAGTLIVTLVRWRIHKAERAAGSRVVPVHLDSGSRSRLKREGAAEAQASRAVAYLAADPSGLSLWVGGANPTRLASWERDGTDIRVLEASRSLVISRLGEEQARMKLLDEWIFGYLNAHDTIDAAQRISSALGATAEGGRGF